MKCKLLNHRMYHRNIYSEKDWKGWIFIRFEIKKKRSTWLISYISYDPICPQHLSSRKFDFIILIYDRPIKKGTLTDVVIQTLYTLYLYILRPCILEKLVGFFKKDFLSIPQQDWGNSWKRICRHKESILIDYNSYKDLSGKFSHSD